MCVMLFLPFIALNISAFNTNVKVQVNAVVYNTDKTVYFVVNPIIDERLQRGHLWSSIQAVTLEFVNV